jgi:hypothetical protein
MPSACSSPHVLFRAASGHSQECRRTTEHDFTSLTEWNILEVVINEPHLPVVALLVARNAGRETGNVHQRQQSTNTAGLL